MEKIGLENKVQDKDFTLNTVMRANDLLGMFQTVTSAPTSAPRTLINQIQIYSSGGTFRIYIYDTVSNAWKYATLT